MPCSQHCQRHACQHPAAHKDRQERANPPAFPAQHYNAVSNQKNADDCRRQRNKEIDKQPDSDLKRLLSLRQLRHGTEKQHHDRVKKHKIAITARFLQKNCIPAQLSEQLPAPGRYNRCACSSAPNLISANDLYNPCFFLVPLAYEKRFRRREAPFWFTAAVQSGS